jgi:hypothetical protein
MTRAELLATLAEHSVSVSIDGSTPTPITAAVVARAMDEDVDVRVMDMSILPGVLRDELNKDGSVTKRRAHSRKDD